MKLAEAQKRLRQRYIDSIPTKIAVLEEQLRGLKSGADDSAMALRRVAHQLSGSAESYGFGDLGALAKKAEHAEGCELEQRGQELVRRLRSIRRETSPVKRRVLVIEDDVAAVELIEEALTDEATAVFRATTADAGKRMLDSSGWDLVLLDLLLPDRDGRELLAELRAELTEDTPVIVLTAHSAAAVRNECVAYGIDGFIEKPVDPSVLAPLAAACMDRRRTVQREAYLDELTALCNRAGFRSALDRALALCRRHKRDCALAYLDVDHFKKFNDDFGHDLGDRALVKLAECLQANLRASDVVGRWGGEEFVVALPETGAEGAVAALAKVADAMRETAIEGCDRALTLSVGVTTIGAEETLDLALLRADKLLYACKQAGRDRILSKLPESVASALPSLLVIDDDPDFTALLAADLAEQFGVTHRASIEAAEPTLAQTKFDMILLDDDLGGRSGIDYLATLGERFPNQGAVVLLTATDCDKRIERAFSAGAVDYITKPYRQRELVARLTSIMRRRPHRQ